MRTSRIDRRHKTLVIASTRHATLPRTPRVTSPSSSRASHSLSDGTNRLHPPEAKRSSATLVGNADVGETQILDRIDASVHLEEHEKRDASALLLLEARARERASAGEARRHVGDALERRLAEVASEIRLLATLLSLHPRRGVLVRLNVDAEQLGRHRASSACVVARRQECAGEGATRCRCCFFAGSVFFAEKSEAGTRGRKTAGIARAEGGDARVRRPSRRITNI